MSLSFHRPAGLLLGLVALVAGANVAQETVPERVEPGPDKAEDRGAPNEARIRELIGAGEWRQAVNEARVLHATHPGSPEVVAVLGQALFRAGRFEEVDAVLGDPAVSAQLPARGLATLGRLRKAQGRHDEAIELMARAVARGPADREVWFWAADATAGRGEAIARYERYLERSAGDDPDRIETARQTIALLEALGDRPIWTPQRAPETLDVPLRRIWDASTGRTQGFVAQAVLGGKKKAVRLLLDSGSPGLFVIERIARKRRFEPLARVTSFGGGGDRRHEIRRGFFPSFALGELEFSHALASTSRQEIEPTGRYHGLLGLAAFSGYRVTLDLPGERLTLERAEGRLEGVPFWVIEGQLLVRAEVGDDDSGLFLLDTGATRTLVDLTLAAGQPGARLGTPVEIHGFGGLLRGARELDALEVRFLGTVQGGDEPLRAADLSMRSRMGGVEIGGFLGLDALAGSRIVIDMAQRRIALESSGD